MAAIKSIARRTFLVGSAVVVGGVVFGTYMVRRALPNPLAEGLAAGDAAFNPWVKVTSQAVTLIAPHTDLGQGVRSMQAMLIAEELDIELDQVVIEPGVPAAAYYNTAAADELLPFMATDESWMAGAARSAGGDVAKLLGLQVTGGSSSVPDSYTKLRMAGAVARETLKAAAAKQSGVPIGQLKTAKGAVVLPDGKAIKYTELASLAATLSPASGVPLRSPTEWRLIGKPGQRTDIVGKSTGTLTYGIDLEMDGMVHAAVRTNPRQGGKLERFDDSAAKPMRGVKKIMPVTGGVAVVADNTWRAFQAAKAIKCEWGPAGYPAEMAAHWTALAAAFGSDKHEARNRDDGKVEEALAGAKVISAEYRAPYLAHQPMEPLSAVVKVGDDGVDVWTTSQLPRFVQGNVAAIAGVPPERVRIHNQYSGGSFGHRLEDDHVKRATEVALAMKGTPVKLTYSREEDFAHDFPRQIAMGRMRGAVKDGKVDAYDLSIAMPSVLTSQFARQPTAPPSGGPDGSMSAGAWDQPFAIPHMRMTAYRAAPLAPISSWRSVGSSTNAFFFNGFLDELILAAGADPLAERIRLCSHEPSRKVLEAVGEMSNWGAKTGSNRADPNRGRGVAFCLSFGTPVAEVVEVVKTDTGAIKIDKVWVAAEVGKVVDPVNFDNLVKGGVVWGLGHAMNCEITYADGMAQQTNFHMHTGMRLNQCPQIQVRGLENSNRIRGIGEPPVPPAAPALAAAIFAVTGKRLREMPFSKFVEFA
jgi:isoquinoline 1-oxidoreductase beta subunit